MKMNKSKRRRLAAAATSNIIAWACLHEHGIAGPRRIVKVKPRFGVRQFQWHLENRLEIARNTQEVELACKIESLLEGEEHFLMLNGILYEGQTLPVSANLSAVREMMLAEMVQHAVWM